MPTLLAALLAAAHVATPVDGGVYEGIPDGGVLVIPRSGVVTVRVPGLDRWASSSESIQVYANASEVTLNAQGEAGTQLDLFFDGGAHTQARVFVRAPDLSSLGVDFLPVTHSPLLSARLMGDRAMVVRGPVGSVEDAVALEVMAEASPKLVVLGGMPASRVADAMSALNAELPSGVRAVWAGDRVVVRGHAAPGVLHAAEEKAETRFGILANAVKAGRVWIEDDSHTLPAFTLGVGSQKVISVAHLTRTAVSKPDVADVKVVNGQQVLVVGLNEGESILEVQREGGAPLRYRVEVNKGWDGVDMVCEICRVLPRYGPGPHIKMVGDKLFIGGPIDTIEQTSEVEAALRGYPNVFLIDHPTDQRLTEQAALVNRRLSELGVTSVRAVRTGAKLWIEGTPKDPSDTAIAQGLIEALFDPFARLMPDARPVPFH